MSIVLQIERFSGQRQVVVLEDGDRLSMTVDSPTRLSPTHDAAKALSKALGSHYECKVTTAPGYEPREYR